jgi:hypothetical protein
MSRPVVELSDVIRQHGNEFIEQFQPLGYHKGVLKAISACRTGELGGHVDQCEDCGYVRISYNSCRNRHCPKCQQVNKERWIMAREAELLPAVQPTEPKQKLSWQEISRKRLNFDPDVCPCCQKGRMRTIEILPPRSPPIPKTTEVKLVR